MIKSKRKLKSKFIEVPTSKGIMVLNTDYIIEMWPCTDGNTLIYLEGAQNDEPIHVTTSFHNMTHVLGAEVIRHETAKQIGEAAR